MPHALCRLTVACQPAVEVGIFVSVTGDTLTHVPDFLRQALKILHLAVTFGTDNFAVNMALVIKQHVFGHIIDFYPGRRRIGVEVFVFLFYPGVIGNNVFMTVQAFFHCRYSGVIGVGHEGVAILALDLFDAAVNIMAERDRLLRSNTGLRWGIEKENKCHNKKSGQHRGQDGDCIFTQWVATSLKTFHTDESAFRAPATSGKRFKKKRTAMTINPKNPTLISPSEMFNGRE